MRFVMLVAVVLMSSLAFADKASGNDTAKNVVYMTKAEKEVVRILNEARTNPPAFANKYLKENSINENFENFFSNKS